MDVPHHVKLMWTAEKGKGVFANKEIKKGEVILPVHFDSIKNRKDSSDMAIQIGEDRFLNPETNNIGSFINHSCMPNLKIDFDKLIYVAIKNIKKGEEICWNYLTTEYEMEDELHFNCKCGNGVCLGNIKGFKFLTEEQKLELIPLLSPFLKSMLKIKTSASLSSIPYD